MKRLPLVLLLAALTACTSTAPAPEPAGGDRFDVEATVLASYNVVSGPAGRRDWDRFKDLFAPTARIVNAADGSSVTPDELANAWTAELNAHDFFQRPVETRVDVAGNAAQVLSRYESRHKATDEQPYARGVKLVQLIRTAEGWRIQSLVWQDDAAAR